QNENSFEAGVEIANKAVGKSVLDNETLFLLFTTPHHKIEPVIAGIKSVIGPDAKFLGCTTTGLVTNQFLSYTGALAGGAYLSSETGFFNIFSQDSIKDREYEAGRNLAKSIRDADTPEDAGILMFYD